LLTGQRQSAKQTGFFSLTLTDQKLSQLFMGDYIWSATGDETLSRTDLSRGTYVTIPLKAKDSNTYLLQRMTATEYPNILVTRNFKAFQPLTELAPQKTYNWNTNEVVHWSSFDGTPHVGILYKPENFDPAKKYPVIFYYYEKMSSAFNLFLTPELSNGTLPVALMVSRGYLVFVPDIHYVIGAPGQSAYNSVVSAAKCLAKYKYVDSKKLGLQGHSFGGYETNYLITQTPIFAAAAESAGVSDVISEYGTAEVSAFNQHNYYESRQGRIGSSLWKKPSLYIKNSPVFYADKVTTPLLMMHNKKDVSVSWSQAVEWFTALQSLGKKVWLLQYEGEGHGIEQKKNQLDYTTRLEQFFDHYLKGEPAPDWMK